MPIDAFISYSHADEPLQQQLLKHLKPLEREGIIRPWWDRRMTAGTEFAKEIFTQLETASLILLLVSPDFFASDYCWDIETQKALERRLLEGTRVIPIILRPVDWRIDPLKRLVPLPKNEKPVTQWQDRDEVFLEVVQSIRGVAEELTSVQSNKAQPTRRLATVSVWLYSRLGIDCDVFVDEQFTKEIRPGGRIGMHLDPGEHNIQLWGFPRQKSNKLFFRASKGEVVAFEASKAGNSWMSEMTSGFGLGEQFVLKPCDHREDADDDD
jgi:hypothetical protein